jgi:hypothetical protein
MEKRRTRACASGRRASSRFWGKFSGGCHLDRDIPAILKEAGFDAQVESMYIPGPRIASYHYWGMATAV